MKNNVLKDENKEVFNNKLYEKTKTMMEMKLIISFLIKIIETLLK